MKLEVNDHYVQDIYVNDTQIIKVYNGDTLIYDKGTLIDVSNYEYTLDNHGNLVLTKYIGSDTNVVNPNI